MGLKQFLKDQGFIQNDQKNVGEERNTSEADKSSSHDAPVFFPVHATMPIAGIPLPVNTVGEPSFVEPLKATARENEQPDPTFIKFFEDELVKANLPGPDYFEFRQLLGKTQQRMTAKGVTAPEVVLQAVLLSFEAQDIPPEKLVEAARHYKEVLSQKNADFLKGAGAEKNIQLQKRQDVLQLHTDNIKKIQQQLQELEMQRKQMEQSLNKENTELEVNKSLGKEGIEKIEKAERLISLAHNYIQSNIDADIKRLQSV